MSTLGVFVTKPPDLLLDIDGALPFSHNHFTGVAPDAEFEAFAPHRSQLHPHQPLHDHG